MHVEISPLDLDVMIAAEARQQLLTKPAGALGRLEALSIWLAGVQGTCPPHAPRRPRLVILAGDHGIARHGVSAYPSDVTAAMVSNFVAGGAAANVLAREADVGLRVLDIAVDGETPSEVQDHKVRRGSGSIDREDALAAGEAQRAFDTGRAIADEEIDSGADLVIIGDMGIGNTTPCAVIAGVLTDSEPIAVVGRGTGVDDDGWMRKVAAVRDAMRRVRIAGVQDDPLALLGVAGSADLAATVGLLVQCALRRTPVLLDGVVSSVCALVAERIAPGAAAWQVAAHRSTEPAQALALAALHHQPLLDLSLRLGEGTGALLAMPLLRAAAATLADMATFESAGVSGRDS